MDLIVELRRWLKFVIGGLLNTAVTYLLYLLLRHSLSYQISYLFAYVVGVIFSFCYNSRVVFDSEVSLGKFIAYPLIYLLHYTISAIFLWVVVTIFGVQDTIAPLVVAGVLLPFSFYLNRRFLRGSNRT